MTEAPLNAKILLIGEQYWWWECINLRAETSGIFLGNSSVGKSSILLRFSDETWLSEDESSATIGVDFRVSLTVWTVVRVC
jgi:hypothetical protein